MNNNLQTFPLYPNTPEPTLQVFLPQSPTGASFIVCPGGGYQNLAEHEVNPPALWLSSLGITTFVLRYRLGPTHRHPVQLHDAARALRTIRHNAPTWNLDPQRIGILGFSAGGHLAATLATHFDSGNPAAPDPIERASSRPNLQILLYPVITMSPHGHSGSRENLLGPNPSPDLLRLLSNELHVTPHTPPAFLVHSTQDQLVPVKNSDDYAAVLTQNNVQHVYLRGEFGGHGFGQKPFWTTPAAHWLHQQNFAQPSPES